MGGERRSGTGAAQEPTSAANGPQAATAAAPARRSDFATLHDPRTARQRAWDACSFDRKLNLFCLLMHGATQVVSLLDWRTLPGSERFQRLLSIVVCGVLAGLPCAPRLCPWYNRRRKEVLIVFRLVFFAFPLLRKARGIQRVLDDEAHPGARGVAKDLLRLVWGSRLTAVLAATMLNPLPLMPLVPHVVLQVYTVMMVRSNSSLCAAPLLRHPLTRERIHGFHAAMHVLASVLPGGVGSTMYPLLARAPRPAEAECEAFLSLFTLGVGLLLPIFVLVRTEPPTSLRAWELKREANRAEGEGGGSGLERLEGSIEAAVRQLCGRSWLAPPEPSDEERAVLYRLRAQLEGGGDAAAAAARKPFRCRLRPWERLFAFWLVLALMWALCVAAATQ